MSAVRDLSTAEVLRLVAHRYRPMDKPAFTRFEATVEKDATEMNFWVLAIANGARLKAE